MTIKSRSALLLALFLFAAPLVMAKDLFSYTVLDLPFQARTAGPWYQVIQSQQEWEKFYTDLIPDVASVPAEIGIPPVIDFANYTMVVGGLGGATGPSLMMGKVIDSSDTVYVNVGKVTPGSNCLVAQVITYPTLTLLIRKTTKKIQVYVDPLLFNCG